MNTQTHAQHQKIVMVALVLTITYLALGLAYMGVHAATPLYLFTIEGDKELTRGSRTTYTVVVQNLSRKPASLNVEHRITIPDMKNAAIPLTLVASSRNVRCVSTRTGALCSVGTVAYGQSVRFKLTYAVKECSLPLMNVIEGGANAMNRYRSKPFSQLFKGCSPSDASSSTGGHR